MADPQLENTGVTHTYVARAWYKDTATWFNLGSFAFLLLQESEFVKLIPVAWHPATTAFVIAFNLWIRFNSSTRPVALTEGKPVQVQSIEPKATEKGSVSDATRSRFLPIVLIALLLGAPTLSGCAKSPPTLSPAGTAAFQATRVVRVLDVLRDFAVDGNAQTPPVLSTASTRKVVDFHEAAVKTIGAVPSGWKPTVVAGLEQLQHDVLPAEWQRLQPYIALVRSLIEVIP